jgi:transcription elongation factor Elf1
MATTTKTLKSFRLTCIACGESEAISLDLNDLAGNCTCGSCNQEFTAKEARAKVADQLKRWDAVCAWIALAGECLADTESE